MKKKLITWSLVKYNRFQTGSAKTGTIIMSGNNPNGFWEKIFELGFDDNVYEVQRTEKDNASICIKVGSFEEDKANISMNAKISDAAKCLLPLLDLLKHSSDGKHTLHVREKEHNIREKYLLDKLALQKPTVGQFREYIISLHSDLDIEGVSKLDSSSMDELYHYFNEVKNWKINNKPMKDWRVEVKKRFLKMIL